MRFLNLLTNRIKIVKGMARYHYFGEERPMFAHLLHIQKVQQKVHMKKNISSTFNTGFLWIY